MNPVRVPLRFASVALALLVLSCALGPAPARAEKADREKPINYSADTGDVNYQTKVGSLAGSVIITQGTLTIRADRVVFRQNPDNSMMVTAYGNPVSFRQKRDGFDEYYEGFAQRVEYDGAKEFVELFDRALLAARAGRDPQQLHFIQLGHRNLQGRGPSGLDAAVRCGTRAARARRFPAEIRHSAPAHGKGCRQGRRQERADCRAAGRHAEACRRARSHPRQMTPDAGVDERRAVSRLAVARLEKRYKARTVVHDVSLDVGSGEVVGLLGPNGAGKTTCFYMIVGLVAADGGRIELDGRDLSRLPIHTRARLGLSYLPQEASIFRKLSVSQNVRAILELQNLDPDALSNRLDALLEDLSISHLADAPALSLSGGERRRVEIARALATRPRFILLDEPFAGVDPIAVIDIQKIIGFLKERGIGVLITDHNVRETLGICDRAYIINEGRVLASGAPGEIVYNEDVRKVYLGEHFRL